jgi:predicted DNA-binding mobile mystery protein A
MQMSIKKVVTDQYRSIANTAGKAVAQLSMPPEGWVRTVRKALCLSGDQLAARVGVTRAQVFKTEKAEVSGNVTIKTLQSMAEAMNCRFVYAIVPHGTIEDLILLQAKRKALKLVKRTNAHMALEDQTLTLEKIDYEIGRLTQQLIDRMPSDFWTDKDK